MQYNFKEHLDQANSLYKIGDNPSLRYCALELRLAIECHVYNQLKGSLGEIPETVINTWQPPQAIKTLCMFQETADKDLHIEITGENIEAIEVTYKNIKYQDLNKWYNTLGSYLHQPTIKKKTSSIDKVKLEKILQNLTELSESNLIIFNPGYEKIKCDKCGSEILYTKKYLEKTERLYCQKMDCKNYLVIRSEPDNNFASFQSITIPCFECDTKNSMPLCDIDAELAFTCKVCKKTHLVKKFICLNEKIAPVPEFTFESATLDTNNE